MRRLRTLRALPFVFIFLAITGLTACGGAQTNYLETFDAPSNWRVANDGNVVGQVENGVYDFHVLANQLAFWTTAGESFADGVYTVKATQIDGPDDNAFGMIFRVDDENDNFYSFQISGDGYVWIGLYENGVENTEPIVGEWWFESTAIKQGANAVNELSVRAEGANLIFYVNGQEVGRVTDDTYSSGDIGLIVRTLGLGGVRIQFDDFSVTPLTAP